MFKTTPGRLFSILSSFLFVSTLLMSPAVTLASHSGNVVLVKAGDPTPDTGGNCGNNANPCDTIQTAVNHASPGNVIKVAAGNYPELVTVNKSLTLQGAQSGRDARGRSNPVSQESKVGTANGAFQITADNVTINGFLIQNVTTNLNAGIHTTGANSGHQILNNIIQDNVMGLYLNSNGANGSLVRNNLFRNNNQPGPAGGTGIYTDQNLSNVVIRDNNFRNHDNASIILGATATTANSNLDIKHNDVSNDVTFLIAYKTTNATIEHNLARNFKPNGSAIYFGGGSSNVNIDHNDLRNASFSGINIQDDGSGFGGNMNFNVNHNIIRSMGDHGVKVDGTNALTTSKISHNDIRGSATDGIRIEATSTGNIIDHNSIRNNTEHDAHDNSVGTGTAGTGNNWNHNDCMTSQPAGLCH